MVVLRYLQFLFSEAEKLLLERAPRSLSAICNLIIPNEITLFSLEKKY